MSAREVKDCGGCSGCLARNRGSIVGGMSITDADFRVLERESPFPRGPYACDFSFDFLPEVVEDWKRDYRLDLDPDFQRAHVWTDAQRAAFVEYVLSGGPSGRDLYFACEGWNRALSLKSALVIVDGKQRLEAVLRFLRDELPVRGRVRSQWTGRMRLTTGARFRFHIADIGRADTLRWYLALNAAGTPHAPEEIDRVRALLDAEVTS